MTGDALPSARPDGKIFCPVLFAYRPIFFRQSHQHRPGSIRKNLCVCLIFPGATIFPLAEKNFLCYAPFSIRKGSCGYDQRNVRLPHAYHFCAGPLRRFLLRGYARHSAASADPVQLLPDASSCADMHAILGIIILDASLLLRSVFVLLSSVTRTVRSLPSLQAC